jgi:hypothetical protein
VVAVYPRMPAVLAPTATQYTYRQVRTVNLREATAATDHCVRVSIRKMRTKEAEPSSKPATPPEILGDVNVPSPRHD